MGFVLCKYPRTISCEPKARISKDGHLVINGPAAKKYCFGDYKYMKFFYDKDKGLIGIELGNKNEFGVIKITKNHVYSFMGFFRYYNLDYKEYVGKYGLSKQEDHAFIMIDLNLKQ